MKTYIMLISWDDDQIPGYPTQPGAMAKMVERILKTGANVEAIPLAPIEDIPNNKAFDDLRVMIAAMTGTILQRIREFDWDTERAKRYLSNRVGVP